MSNVYVVGSAMTVFGRHPERSLHDLAGEALQGALKDAGCTISDFGTAFYAGITNGRCRANSRFPAGVFSRSASKAFRSSTSKTPAHRVARRSILRYKP